MEPENRLSCVRPGSTSRLREPVTGRQERPNSSTRSHDPITDLWKEIRHDYLEETSGCACLGARRDRAGIAKLRAGSRPRHQRERSYDSLGATDPTGAVGKPDSGPALGSRAGTHHQRAVVTARVPGPNRNRAMMPCGHSTPVQHRTAPQTARNAGASDAQLSEAAQVAAALPRGRGNHPRHEICSAIETSMSSSLNIARRWNVARWAPIPLRLIVGYGFIAHGYAKLVKDPYVFVGILHAIWHSRASWCHIVQSFCSWLSIRHRRYDGDLRSNQKDGRQCTEHLRRDRRSAAVKAVPAAGGVPYLHIIVERSTRYVVAAGLVLFGLLLPTTVTAQQRASVANDLSVIATATDGRSHAVAAKPDRNGTTPLTSHLPWLAPVGHRQPRR